MNSRRSWLIFGVGVLAYVIAVMQRTSLGVASVSASERFGGAASELAALAVLQLVVYAGMQIPVGVLIDRLGPRVLMIAGSSIMVAGQVTVAFSTTIGFAVLGRILVGAGDAMIFISLIRLVNSWFEGRIVPQLSQWIGNIGQLGQVLSAVPFAIVLHSLGWEWAFLSAASASVVAVIGTVAAIRDRPATSSEPPRVTSWSVALGQLRASFARPGTQLGFWSHFVSQSPGTVFSLLWGIPFLVYGLGYSEELSASLLIVLVAAGVVAGPILGLLSARFPLRRSNLVLGVVAAMAVVWTIVLLWPGVPPLWLVVVLIAVLGVGGPGSVIGFDFARTFNPIRSLGSANGVVNVGGFLASFVMMFVIGLVLDAQAGGSASSASIYTLDAFRLAFCVQYAVVGFGVVMLLRARRRTRRRLVDDEGIEVAPLWVSLMKVWRGGGRGSDGRQTMQ
ncbi:MFS transporter [Compostimonas suwonensis]|uniref:Sugar phosphate permease n=1 Tax=Compostimonas suwonensis TaxID=1048394 RepID=A0A2M9BBK6_9MICO|nr:MFS transporter [Compostimonas suwonensis]PJJ55327.1 sugar phosphate permease [Compostimonas suwonensis]